MWLKAALQRQERHYRIRIGVQVIRTKAIGQKGLLEVLNWPNWREEVERTAESQVDQALQILVDSGLPEEQAMAIRQFVMSSSEQLKNNGR